MCPISDGYGVMAVLNSEEKVTITDHKQNKCSQYISFLKPTICTSAIFVLKRNFYTFKTFFLHLLKY